MDASQHHHPTHRVTMVLTDTFRDVVNRAVAHVVSGAAGRRERGAQLIEYGLLVALIAAVCVLAVSLLGQHTSTGFSSIGQRI